ncbi:MAG: glycoside hydrolase family 3 protein [Bacteroidales bacterium]|nr:glycoside hydrolase family 3 protein [Bacteroidales bacterium]
MKTPISSIAILLMAVSCSTQLGKSPVEKVVGEMTLDEKVRTVVGTFTDVATPPPVAPGVQNRADYPGAGENTARTYNQVPGAAGDGYPVARLGIPAIVYADGPAGLRIDPRREGEQATYFCTAFPSASLLSASWDPALVERVGAAIGDEVLRYGVDILLAPGMNLQRNPLTGRNFEYYSEDPLLSGLTAAAYVNGVQSQGVGTSVKHFAANNQELYRNGINEIISDRALRELYLRGFEIVVKKAQPWTVMSSYNKINGTYASENNWLLSDVLRDEWGYEGFVMTDWFGADDPVLQMEAGNDLLMPGTPNQIDELSEAVASGKLPVEVLDRNVARILRVLEKAPRVRGYAYKNDPDLSAHAVISREAATEGMVLLHNNGVLPLRESKSVALFGNYAYDTQPGGSGSGYVNRAYKITLDKGLEAAGFKLDKALADSYRKHIAFEKSQMPEEYFWVVPTASEYKVSTSQIAASSKSDIAVITLGRMSGEGGDRSATEGDYLLSAQEKLLLKDVYKTFHGQGKPVVVVFNIGAPVDLSGVEAFADAILLAWLPGQEAGYAITDILTGAVNPSGKLPVTLAGRYEDVPSARNFGLSAGEINTVRYEEELMVGYRYFSTSGVKPLYPFGYGLSYTSFEYSDFLVDGDVLQVTVKNTGSCAGRETVQFYVAKPAIESGRPARELCAFAKTSSLEPGCTETLRVPLADTVNPLEQWADGRWVLAHGPYRFWAAASSEDLRLSCEVNM